MKLRRGLDVDESQLAAFCRSHGVRRLAAFGSVLSDRFSDTSDVDLLVEFKPDHIPGLMALAAMELELANLFGGREIELRTYEDLSRHFRDRARAGATLLYDAALRTRSGSAI